MAKIARKTSKLFASTAGGSDIGVFGSLAAGSPAYSTDPAVIQSLSNFLTGWAAETIATRRPAYQDFNALDFLTFYQLGYLFQAGIPEWDAGTNYFTGSICTAVGTGILYRSLTDNNLNNAVTDASKWETVIPASAPGGVLGAYKNLKVSYASATQVLVTADEIILEDSSNNKAVVRSLNQVADITSGGANGLDTGAEASSTWYYVWVIAKADGTKGVLLSASSTTPTLPSGYIYKVLVSAVRNDGSSNFVSFTQEGKIYTYTSSPVLASGGTSSAWVGIDTTNYVPSALSTLCFGSATTINGGGGQVAVSNSNGDTPWNTVAGNQIYGHVASGGSNMCQPWRYHLLTANTLYWASANISGVQVALHGFEINKLS